MIVLMLMKTGFYIKRPGSYQLTKINFSNTIDEKWVIFCRLENFT